MCGQLSFSSNSNFDVDKIKTLIYINAIERGMDATGFYSPKNGLKKSVISGDWLVTCASHKHPIVPDTFFMGHCRAATVGEKDIKNAHPFKRGNYILQHNGTLTNHKDLLEKYKLPTLEYNVDSDIICGCIEKANNITTVLKELNGPAAIVIRDVRKPDLMYVFRNKDRPLFKGYIDNSMYISSVGESLVLIGCSKVSEFKENTLYIIKNGEIKSSNILKNIPYKHEYPKPIVTTNVTTMVNDFMNRRFIFKSLNCWIRSKHTITIMSDGNFEFKLKRDKYYLVDKVISNMEFKILDTETGQYYNCSTSYLQVEEDTIYQDDWVRAEIDVPYGYKKDIIACKKGEIFKCRDSFNDGELTLNEVGTDHYLTNAKKINFYKLSPEEIKKHEDKIKTIKDNLKPVVINSAEQSAKTFMDKLPFDTEDNQQNLDGEIVTNNDSDAFDDELSSYFDNMDNELENLLNLANNQECSIQISNKITELIELNFIASDEFSTVK